MPTLPSRLGRWCAAVGAACGSLGCAMSFGPTVGREARVLSGGGRVATTAGVAWSQQVRPDRDLGLLVGYELAVHGQQGVDSGPGFRVLGSVGFTDPPEGRAEPPVAHEAVLRLGYAGFTDRGGFVHAFVVGPRFALPIEVAAATQPRAGALPFTTAWQLVPEVGGSVALSPYHSPRLDGGLGLSVRLQLDAARPR